MSGDSAGPATRLTPTPSQLHALFDILTHRETYAEAESFKDPEAITRYGFPFNSTPGQESPSYAAQSATPLLQLLLTRCILTVPGVHSLPPEFWNVKFQGILAKLAQADLSESYDKGALGTRKTLCSAACVIHEAVTRGLLGGVAGGPRRDLRSGRYDSARAEDLVRAWRDCVHELVYGALADELFAQAAASDDFEAHSPAVRAAADYAIVHIASLLHHVFVLSPEGQYMLKLLENVHKLVPYSMVRQTLRISNAATMMNGIIRIFLAKLSVGSMTNWIGLTRDAEDGMNLLQRIISLVLSWDSSEFRKVVEKVEASKDKPSKEHLAALRQHLNSTPEIHAAAREASLAQHKSIVAVILDSAEPKLAASLTESQHAQCLEWYSAQLSMRDRDELTNVLCRQSPDLFTSALRDLVATFDPMIRHIHGSIDLREHISAMESFVDDFIETSKPKKDKGENGNSNGIGIGIGIGGGRKRSTRPPSVEDYVALLRRNRHLLYKYCHQFAKNCVDVREKFRGWANETLKWFRHDGNMDGEMLRDIINLGIRDGTRGDKTRNAVAAAETAAPSGAGVMSAKLQFMFAQLPRETQQSVLSSLDAHAAYLSSMTAISARRMQRILDDLPDIDGENDGNGKTRGKKSRSSSPSPSRSGGAAASSMSGPGVFLCRWDAILDETLITPETPAGAARRGRDVRGQRAWGKTGATGPKDGWDADAISREEERVVPAPPNVDVVVEALGGPFRDLVASMVRSDGSDDSV